MSIDWLLIFTRDLPLALWLGDLIVIDSVEIPAKFRVAEINRSKAVAVRRAVFAALSRLEVVAERFAPSVPATTAKVVTAPSIPP